MFGYGSVSIDDVEAFDIIEKARANYPVQLPELKASRLMQTTRGRSLVSELIMESKDRFAINVYDKLLALGGWVFEYIYEPVYKDDPSLLYQKNLHRFVAMFTWMFFRDVDSGAEEAIRQFQKYMRTRDETQAPMLFGRISNQIKDVKIEHPFDMILRFARGYRSAITLDNSNINIFTPEGGKWTLDLSASALWSHLNYWGKREEPLAVDCDASKPLQAIARHFLGDENDPGIKRARLMGNKDQLGWKLASPIAFVDSRDHPAVQLADVIVGAVIACFTNGVPKDFEASFDCIRKHILPDTILPDFDVIDLNQRNPAVNYVMLYDLAQRAEQDRDPYDGLHEMYLAAEVAWVRGDFKILAR